MMKQYIKASIILLLCLSLTGCLQSVPTVESVEDIFERNFDDIQLVVDFMINTGCTDVYIDSADCTMLADMETLTISNKTVNDAVKRLIRGQYSLDGQYYGIYKMMYTIKFLQWKHMEVGCGIAYTTSETLPPRIEYCTELVPLSEPGWYYYISDYNEWRVQHQQPHNSSTE